MLRHLKISEYLKLIGFVVHCVFRNTFKHFERKEEERNPGEQAGVDRSGMNSAKIRTLIYIST